MPELIISFFLNFKFESALKHLKISPVFLSLFLFGYSLGTSNMYLLIACLLCSVVLCDTILGLFVLLLLLLCSYCHFSVL